MMVGDNRKAHREPIDGSDPVGSGCPYTTVTAGNAYDAWISGMGMLNIEVVTSGLGGGAWTCPPNTSFIEVIDLDPDPAEVVRCQIEAPPGVSLAELVLDGFTVMAPPEQTCSIGLPQFQDSQFVCYLGSAPDGTSAFKLGNAFYYEGWD